MKKINLFIIYFLLSFSCFSQVKITNEIGTPPADASAILDINSNGNKGVLLPRLTSIQRLGINSPASGLMVFDLDKKTIYSNIGTSLNPIWQAVLTTNNISSTTTIIPVTDNSGSNVLGFKLIDGNTIGQVLQWDGSSWVLAQYSAGNDLVHGSSLSGNTLIGLESGTGITSGVSNTFIGKGAGSTTSSGNNNIIVGSGVNATNPTASNQIIISPFLKGQLIDTDNTPSTFEKSSWSIGSQFPDSTNTLIIDGPTKIQNGDLQILNKAIRYNNTFCRTGTARPSGSSPVLAINFSEQDFEGFIPSSNNDYMVFVTKRDNVGPLAFPVVNKNLNLSGFTITSSHESQSVLVDWCLIKVQ